MRACIWCIYVPGGPCPGHGVRCENSLLVTIMDAKDLIWWCIAIALVFFSVIAIVGGFRKGLRQVPGPFLARFSGLYRLSLVYAGKAPHEYRRVHQRYGRLVRVGPNHVSISDPTVIPQIYGIGTDFPKVNQAP